MTTDLAQIATDEMFGRLSHAQAHAARALQSACPYCGKDPCPDRDQHEVWDAGNETTWWRRWMQ